MKIGIVGLGLIGGSLAKALKARTEHEVLGADAVYSTLCQAKLAGAIDGELLPEQLGECDFVILATYPKATVDYITQHAAKFNPQGIVMDCGGTKRVVCQAVYPLAQAHGFTFVGAHPMAGMAASGFSNARETLFVKAPMILTPYPGTDIRVLERVQQLCFQMGFTRTPAISPEEHDRMIAYTSQMAHVVSSAYIQNPLALAHKGYSAGSFRDLTRVARLNADMWTELFMENADPLTEQLDVLLEKLTAYRAAIHDRDEAALHALLEAGTACKLAAEEKEKSR
ncbi:MAG: prephenate dehydrogenase/arogenate dehydrogenase family protein [Eubacteriales bacterium]|nr:prephenate dehydrogenase/arogenate dehydrogenase family protein [Eubacteriales bacterium]